jgi:hypothetical protein
MVFLAIYYTKYVCVSVLSLRGEGKKYLLPINRGAISRFNPSQNWSQAVVNTSGCVH